MKRNRRFLKGLTFAFLALFLFSSFVFADGTMRSARVTDITGDVKIRKAGGEKLFPATDGMGLVQGDMIICGKDGIAKLKMDEDKEIRIANSTQILISQLEKLAADAGEKTSLSLLSGKVLITINKKLEKDSKFDIKTPTAVMGVRGTQFLVAIRTGATNVAVINGTVNVTNSFSGLSTAATPLTTVQVSQTLTPPAPQPLQLQSLDLFTLQGIKDTGTIPQDLQQQLDQTIQEKQKLEESTPPPPVEEDEEYMFDPEYLIYEEDGTDYGDPGDLDESDPDSLINNDDVIEKVKP